MDGSTRAPRRQTPSNFAANYCLTGSDLDGLYHLYPLCSGARVIPGCLRSKTNLGFLRVGLAFGARASLARRALVDPRPSGACFYPPRAPSAPRPRGAARRGAQACRSWSRRSSSSSASRCSGAWRSARRRTSRSASPSTPSPPRRPSKCPSAGSRLAGKSSPASAADRRRAPACRASQATLGRTACRRRRWRSSQRTRPQRPTTTTSSLGAYRRARSATPVGGQCVRQGRPLCRRGGRGRAPRACAGRRARRAFGGRAAPVASSLSCSGCASRLFFAPFWKGLAARPPRPSVAGRRAEFAGSCCFFPPPPVLLVFACSGTARLPEGGRAPSR